jgi:UDP-N-acetyl-D-mannosaminuronic acid dehydrogenase
LAADSPKAVVVLGNGYVGLPLSLLLAKSGHKVLAVDTDERVVRGIRSGDLHIDEPGLRELREDPTVAANLRASIDVAPADVFVIAVPTPLRPRRKTADLGKVEAAMRSIVEHLAPGNLVILESTVPPRTCEDVIVPLLDESGLRVGTDVLLAHCPGGDPRQ